MGKVVTFMSLMKEVYFILDVNLPKTEFFCKVFEYNQIYIAVTESNKFSPRTKNITIQYHHLQIFVQKNIIWICYIDTK